MSQSLFVYTQLYSFKYFYRTLILLFIINHSVSHCYIISILLFTVLDCLEGVPTNGVSAVDKLSENIHKLASE